MKRKSAVLNLIGFILALMIIGLGILIPSLLLNEQENAIIGSIATYEPPYKTPLSPISTPKPTAVDELDEFAARLYVFNNIQNAPIAREPYAHELDMEHAVSALYTQLYLLLKLNAIPPITPEEYELESAQLSYTRDIPKASENSFTFNSATVRSDLGLWFLRLKNVEAGSLTVLLDAETGKIICLYMPGYLYGEYPSQRENVLMFAKYHDLLDNDFNIISDSNMTTLDFKRLGISCIVKPDHSKATIEFSLECTFAYTQEQIVKNDAQAYQYTK